MSVLTLEIPEELAERLSRVTDVPRVLELGLREIDAAAQQTFAGSSDVLEFLAALPSAEETLALRPSPVLAARVNELLAKNRDMGLSPEEREEWGRYEYLEHLVRIAKAKAALKLKHP